MVEGIRSEIDLGEYEIESDITHDENEDEDEQETEAHEGDKKRRKMNRERKGRRKGWMITRSKKVITRPSMRHGDGGESSRKEDQEI